MVERGSVDAGDRAVAGQRKLFDLALHDLLIQLAIADLGGGGREKARRDQQEHRDDTADRDEQATPSWWSRWRACDRPIPSRSGPSVRCHVRYAPAPTRVLASSGPGVPGHLRRQKRPGCTRRCGRWLAGATRGTPGPLAELLAKDVASVDGDRTDLDDMLGLLDTFTAAFGVVVPNLR